MFEAGNLLFFPAGFFDHMLDWFPAELIVFTPHKPFPGVDRPPGKLIQGVFLFTWFFTLIGIPLLDLFFRSVIHQPSY
jgi:hypothetical protein